MANKPSVANELALQERPPEIQRRQDQLKIHAKSTKTFTGSPRVYKIKRRDQYVVVDQSSPSSRFKSGYVPVNPLTFSSSSLFSAPIFSDTPRKIKLRRLQQPRSARLSERTFRKPPQRRNIRYRSYSGTGMPKPKSSRSSQIRKSVTEKVSKTTDSWLPSLKSTNLTRFERPFLRPLNAIEQILNDEIVEPTAGYIKDFKVYVTGKMESSFPEIYRSTQITELPETEGGAPGDVAEEVHLEEHPQASECVEKGHSTVPPKKNGDFKSIFRDRKETTYVLHVVAQVEDLAKVFVKKIRLSKLATYAEAKRKNRRNRKGNMPEEYVPSYPKDSLQSIRRDPPGYVMMSPCSSFQFGPPIRPYSPANHGAQMVLSPVSSLSLGNLRLSPGKELYMAETIDITDLRSEGLKTVMRVRVSRKTETDHGINGARCTPIMSADEPDEEKVPQLTFGEGISGPLTCVLLDDPQLTSYILPLNTNETLQSPVTIFSPEPKSADTFSEFGYQLVDSAEALNS